MQPHKQQALPQQPQAKSKLAKSISFSLNAPWWCATVKVLAGVHPKLCLRMPKWAEVRCSLWVVELRQFLEDSVVKDMSRHYNGYVAKSEVIESCNEDQDANKSPAIKVSGVECNNDGKKGTIKLELAGSKGNVVLKQANNFYL